MVRIIGFFVGLGFVGVLLLSFVINGVDYLRDPPEHAAYYYFHKDPREAELPSDGMFGRFDRAQLQRGFQVYKEVCAACHGLKQVAFYQLADLGYSEAEVKAIANQWAIEVPSVNPDTGEVSTRKALISDRFPSPYANETAARAANNNAYPPDLSLITEAREDGTNYLYSLLTGYQNPPAELLKRFPDAKPGPGLHYNPYFANLNIAMPAPIVSDGQVTYADGTAATKDQMAKDVAAFLTWTAEPNLEARHRTGWAVLIFLTLATVFAYMAYRQVWAEAKRKVGPHGPLDPKYQAGIEQSKAESGIAG